jgi:creatinine amidohydrolase
MMSVIRPDLVHAEDAKNQTGEDQARLKDLPFGYTGIWWYARFPNHYDGDGSQYSKELGKLLLKSDADQLVELISYLKKNNTIETLTKEFYSKAGAPVK